MRLKKREGEKAKDRTKTNRITKTKNPEKQTDKQIKKHISMISISTVSMRKY